jgi:photosystem II stability/assembly factor-like uncharacterized protein
MTRPLGFGHNQRFGIAEPPAPELRLAVIPGEVEMNGTRSAWAAPALIGALVLTTAIMGTGRRVAAQAAAQPPAKPATAQPSAPAPAAPALPAASPAEALKKLQWRNIGPTAQTGRVPVIVGVPGEPDTFYVGAAAGGVFKTTNHGTAWKAIFDDQPNVSIGAIAIAPSDPNVIYVGTGEANPRNSASFGEGVFKTIDAGEHWIPLGLSATEKISRIVVDPRNHDVAYVCALGHEWGPNEERGVFKTTDGGRKWTKLLYKNDLTGCSDLDIDPTNSNVVYAGMYTFRRWAWYFDSGGGETAVYKSSDGGFSWMRLSGPEATRGLPKGPMDRIGVRVAPSNPNIVYVISETKDEGIIWRSDDAGATWRAGSRDPNIVFRPFYYADIRVDPNHPNTVYALAGGLYKSEDGARTFARIGAGTHGDHHGMWIDPANSDRVLSADDGGFQVSYDGGKTFDILNNIPFTQFYNVAYDLQVPYHLCGGLQDNGTWCGPSQSPGSLGTTKAEWQNVGGGDGFFGVPDLKDPHLVYNNLQGGVISLTDRRSGASWGINPYPGGIGSSGQWMEGQKYRFNWNAPIVLSPQDPKTVFYGGNVLFKTTNYGHSWEVISPDLTTNDTSKQKSSGGQIVTDNTAAEFHCTILSIGPSPLDPNLIWVGTDDGNVQLTRDGGKTWTNTFASPPGLRPYAWINKVEASRFDAGTAYVSASHWQDNDYTPYFYRTADYGKTWTRITSGLPAKGWSHVIREDPKTKDLLYAGTENGLYASWDGGAKWISIRNNIPPVPVRDIAVHPRDNDIIVATHGRGIYILDDASPLQQIAAALKAEAFLFPVRPAIRWAGGAGMFRQNERDWIAPNPPVGAMIHLYVKTAPKEPLTVTITDKAGKTVRTMRNQRVEAGVNRLLWNLRADNPAEQAGPPMPGMADIPVAILERFGFGSFGPYVVPGEYVVKVRTAAGEQSSPVTVQLDPAVTASTADLAAQYEAAQTVLGMQARVNAVVDRANDLITQLTNLDALLGKQQPAPAVRQQVRQALDTIKTFRDAELVRPAPAMNYRMYPRLREDVQSLSGNVSRGFRAPNAGEKERMKDLVALVDRAVTKLNGIISGDIAAINQAMSQTPRIIVDTVK